MPTPIALIAYRRPDHLAQVLSALKSNPECRDTALYVFSDAPKTESEKSAVNRVREIIPGIEGFASVHPILRPYNFGLSRNIIDAANHVLSKHGEMIMIEDDIYVAPNFLKFMRDGLDRYREEHRVSCLSGYWYPVEYGSRAHIFSQGSRMLGLGDMERPLGVFQSKRYGIIGRIKIAQIANEFRFRWCVGFYADFKRSNSRPS